MDTLRRITALLLLALMVASAPLSHGLLVFCATPDGHRAVEVGHGPAGCSETSPGESSDRQSMVVSDCTDTPLSLIQHPATRPARAAHDAALSTSLPVCLVAWANTPKPDRNARWSARDTGHISSATPAMLRTVVLLI